GAPGRGRPGACAVRVRSGQLHRDPERRPGIISTAAAARADARRRAAGSRGALPRPRRRVAAQALTTSQTVTPMETDHENMKRKTYEKELVRLQGKLCILQHYVKEKGLRVIIVFEGRDAAGKGGT